MKKKIKIIIGVLVFTSGVIIAGIVGVIIWNHPDLKHQRYVIKYLERNTDLSPEIRTAIQNGKVILGMYPDEAQAAAGQFMYQVQADPKWGREYFPPQVIFSQKKNPDDSKIEMTFWTKTQFSTKERKSFTVSFEKGKAVKITKNN